MQKMFPRNAYFSLFAEKGKKKGRPVFTLALTDWASSAWERRGGEKDPLIRGRKRDRLTCSFPIWGEKESTGPKET